MVVRQLVRFISSFLPELVMINSIRQSVFGTCDCIFIQWARDFNSILSLLIIANFSNNPSVFAWRLQPYRKAVAKILTCRGEITFLSEQSNVSMNSLGPSTRNLRGTGASEKVEGSVLKILI